MYFGNVSRTHTSVLTIAFSKCRVFLHTHTQNFSSSSTFLRRRSARCRAHLQLAQSEGRNHCHVFIKMVFGYPKNLFPEEELDRRKDGRKQHTRLRYVPYVLTKGFAVCVAGFVEILGWYHKLCFARLKLNLTICDRFKLKTKLGYHTHKHHRGEKATDRGSPVLEECNTCVKVPTKGMLQK